MGREADVLAKVGREAGAVKVLLETDEIILRGAIKRRFPKSSITELSTNGATLRFVCEGESVTLELGQKAAISWAKAIKTPAPTLRAKLGIGQSKILFLGSCDDPHLQAALQGATTHDPALADLIVARIEDSADLAAAQAARPGLPIWAIYAKGKNSPIGETTIRTSLRDAKYRDTKKCAVSDRLTALRFNPIN